MSSELATIDWLGQGWLLVLSFTVAVLLVVVLRKPCRHLFGTERAFQLWLLPLLAMLVSQLPHAAVAPVVVLSSVVSTIATATTTLPAYTAAASAVDWRICAALLWLGGAVGSLLRAAVAQSRYRVGLRSATPVTGLCSHRPVLRANSADIGPALVGAWRSRIVLPADFERRYDAIEQALILAHEATHARRGDGWWCLLAQIVAAIFWFHPLGWWALAALRHDQELACDAAVLREHGTQRRSYANAMLKTQSAAFALPVGCAWSPRHPITERIVMLKLKQPDLLRRRAGGVLIALIAVGLTGLVYAATPSPQAIAAAGPADHYTLKIDTVMGGRPGSRQFTYCLKPGEYVDVNGTDAATGKFTWKGRFAVSPAASGQLEIRSQVDTRFDRGNGVVREKSAKPIVRTMPGQQATVVFGQIMEGKQREKLEDNTIKLAMTPSPGCSHAALASEVKPARPSTVDSTKGADARQEYQLNTSVELTTDNGRSDNTRRATLALCTTSGKKMTFKVHDWVLEATPVSEGGRRLRIDLVASDTATHTQFAQASLHGSLNELLHADGRGKDGKSRWVMEITPLEGCPARTIAARNETHA